MHVYLILPNSVRRNDSAAVNPNTEHAIWMACSEDSELTYWYMQNVMPMQAFILPRFAIMPLQCLVLITS